MLRRSSRVEVKQEPTVAAAATATAAEGHEGEMKGEPTRRKRARQTQVKKEEKEEEEEDESGASHKRTRIKSASVKEESEASDDDDADDGGDGSDVATLEELAASAGVSVYEYTRQQNIRLKNEQLQLLNLSGISSELGLRTKPTPTRTNKQKVKKEPQTGTRRSMRASVRDPNYQPPPPIYVPEISATDAYKGTRKEGPLTLKDALPGELDEEDEKNYRDVLNSFDSALLLSDRRVAGLTDAGVSAYRQSGAINQSKLRMLGNPNHSLSMKVVKGRATAVRVHPTASLTNDFSLVAASDKNGQVGIAKYSNVAPVSTWHETFQVAQYAPHVNSVVDLHWSTLDSHLLYSGARDGSVRVLDVSAGMFNEVFVEDATHGASCSGLGLAPDHRSVLVGDRAGFVHMVDVRSADGKKRRGTRLEAGNKSINACVIHPTDQNMLVTGGLDRVVRAWDLRRFVPDKPIKEWTHQQAINSVTFSTSGDHLVSTSYDCTLKLWSCTNSLGGVTAPDRWLPPTIIKHDNITGRWVSRFKAVFAPADNALAIGSMKRNIDVIMLAHKNKHANQPSQPAPAAASSSSHPVKGNADSTSSVAPPTEGPTLLLQHPEWVTTIPATVAWHPNRVQVVGCTGSGRLYVYGAPN